MENNRDESESCIQIALKALEVTDIEMAGKFLKKAEQLYPTQLVKGNSTNLLYCSAQCAVAILNLLLKQTELTILTQTNESFCLHYFIRFIGKVTGKRAACQ